MKNRLAAFFVQKKEVPCMGYARKDVEKTKKIAKKYKMTVTEVVLQGLEKVLNRPE